MCTVLPMLIITSFGPLKLTLTTHHTTTFCNHISSTFRDSTNRRSPDVASTGEVAKDVESKTAMHKLQGIKHIEHECVMYEGVNHGCPVTDLLCLCFSFSLAVQLLAESGRTMASTRHLQARKQKPWFSAAAPDGLRTLLKHLPRDECFIPVALRTFSPVCRAVADGR